MRAHYNAAQRDTGKMNESSGNSPLSSEQLIYLEFNGGDNLSYRGELLSLDGISVESSGSPPDGSTVWSNG